MMTFDLHHVMELMHLGYDIQVELFTGVIGRQLSFGGYPLMNSTGDESIDYVLSNMALMISFNDYHLLIELR